MRLPLLFLTCLLLAAPSHAAGRPVGVTTIPFTKTSVTTGAPRVLETVVWYPAKPRTGTSEALGQRDAEIRPGRYPLVSHRAATGRRVSTAASGATRSP